MVLEVAVLRIKSGQNKFFGKDFKRASQYISAAKGYMGHQLKKCIEKENQYILLVHWETLEGHEDGFRNSKEYLEWKKLLHHYYDPFPEVLHYV